MRQKKKQYELDFSHLKTAFDLKEIILSDCEQFDDSFELKINSLLSLEIISLSCNNISTSNLQILLKAAPNLKELELASCKNLNNATLILDEYSLLNLEKIALDGSTISLENIKTLLKAAPNVQELDLKECYNFSDTTLILDENSLPNLEAIELEGSTISRENLQIFLNAAPNLKEITLFNCQNLTNSTLVLLENSLPNLEKISLIKGSISPKNLKILLKAAPALKEISLISGQNLNETLDLDENSLSNLEWLNFANSQITPNTLQKLLKAAPNLKKIHLIPSSAVTL